MLDVFGRTPPLANRQHTAPALGLRAGRRWSLHWIADRFCFQETRSFRAWSGPEATGTFRGTANTSAWRRRSAKAGLAVTTVNSTVFPSFASFTWAEDGVRPHHVNTTTFSFVKSTCLLTASRLASSAKAADFASSSAVLISISRSFSSPSQGNAHWTFVPSSARTGGLLSANAGIATSTTTAHNTDRKSTRLNSSHL